VSSHARTDTAGVPAAEYRFAGFTLIPAERRLASSPSDAVTLQPKVLETLLALLEANGALVTKERLLSRVWPDVEVQEGSLTRNIYLLRRILGETAVETVAKSGYRFTLLPVEAATSSRKPRVVVVLPVADLGPDLKPHLADGITEELIDTLTQLPDLRVLARATSFHLRDRDAALKLGLGVDTIIEASLRCAGLKVRVSIRQVDAVTGHSVWTDNFSRELGDVFELQAEMAAAVAQRISPASLHPPSFRPAPEAYDAYAHGRFLAGSDSNARLAEALASLERAVTLEPGYAAAHAAIADAHFRYLTYGDSEDPDLSAGVVRRHVDLALQADPRNAHAAMLGAALTCVYDWDFSKGEREFRAVIRANPSFGFARYLYAYFLLTPQGRFREAEEQLMQALQLDPLSTHIQAARISLLLFEGRIEEAIQSGYEVARHDPASCLIAVQYSWALMSAGRFEEAAAELARARKYSGETLGMVIGSEGLLTAMSGDFAQAFEILPSGDAFNRARLHLWLGQVEAALQLLDQAHSRRTIALTFLDRIPEFAALRGNERYEGIRASVGLCG
jgi:TolB-like protein/Tfp pilus assembly protein PilF